MPLLPLFDLPLEALRDRATTLGLAVVRPGWRDGLIAAIAQHLRPADDADVSAGILEVHTEGFGFLRSPLTDLLPAPGDIYVSQSQIRRFNLRTGDSVVGRTRAPREGERYPALLRVERVNGASAEVAVTAFADRAVVHPSRELPLATDPWLAPVERLAPLGQGARGLIVGSARSARSELLRRIALATSAAPDLDLLVLLLGERPEDIADGRGTVSAEIIATPFDEAAQRHVHVADITFERARRLAERGSNVVLLVDAFSRLLRHVIADLPAGGRTIEGVDAAALHRLRGWFATGRDLQGGGSVTLIGTVDADAEGALAPALRRDLADAATWQVTLSAHASFLDTHPRVDVDGTWTRREAALVGPEEAALRARLRETLAFEGQDADICAVDARLRGGHSAG